MNYARDLVAEQRLCRTCRHTGRSAAQTADVRRIQPFRVDLGHFDAAVRDAKAPFMPNYTGHFTCPATAAHLFSCQKSLQYSVSLIRFNQGDQQVYRFPDKSRIFGMCFPFNQLDIFWQR